ncbi:hypothetical protein V8G54_030012 [Vigna mungo]|uniref:Uncharacterized protein n=1 Tax=Vigna mungo TaxID=3915 RepID=A0AAQ3MVE5_VIGMU
MAAVLRLAEDFGHCLTFYIHLERWKTGLHVLYRSLAPLLVLLAYHQKMGRCSSKTPAKRACFGHNNLHKLVEILSHSTMELRFQMTTVQQNCEQFLRVLSGKQSATPFFRLQTMS